MQNHAGSPAGPLPGVSRRTVTRGIAWTAPVITGVAVAPALAASPATNEVTLTGGCYESGFPHLALTVSAGANGWPSAEPLVLTQTATLYTVDRSQGDYWLRGDVLDTIEDDPGITASPWSSTTTTLDTSDGYPLWQHSAVRQLVIPSLDPNSALRTSTGDLRHVPFGNLKSKDGHVRMTLELNSPTLSPMPAPAHVDRIMCSTESSWAIAVRRTCNARGEGGTGLEVVAYGDPLEPVEISFTARGFGGTPDGAEAMATLDELLSTVSLDPVMTGGTWSAPTYEYYEDAGYGWANSTITVTIDPGDFPVVGPWPALVISSQNGNVYAYIWSGIGGVKSQNYDIIRAGSCAP